MATAHPTADDSDMRDRMLEQLLREAEGDPEQDPIDFPDRAHLESLLQDNRMARKQQDDQCKHRPVPCGGGDWRKVVDIDMSLEAEQCPSTWVEVTSPDRSCGKTTSAKGCQSAFFSVVGGSYSKVCGRAVAYSDDTPDAFAAHIQSAQDRQDINKPYVDGISITVEYPRKHIFSLAAGHGPLGGGASYRCPCDNPNRSFAPLPASFVGDNYFCDGEYNGALFDGMDCTTDCCKFNSPPYFSVSLASRTSEDIEVRICTDQNDDTVTLGSLELYVQ